jgi:hypothetical protein
VGLYRRAASLPVQSTRLDTTQPLTNTKQRTYDPIYHAIISDIWFQCSEPVPRSSKQGAEPQPNASFQLHLKGNASVAVSAPTGGGGGSETKKVSSGLPSKHVKKRQSNSYLYNMPCRPMCM